MPKTAQQASNVTHYSANNTIVFWTAWLMKALLLLFLLWAILSLIFTNHPTFPPESILEPSRSREILHNIINASKRFHFWFKHGLYLLLLLLLWLCGLQQIAFSQGHAVWTDAQSMIVTYSELTIHRLHLKLGNGNISINAESIIAVFCDMTSRLCGFESAKGARRAGFVHRGFLRTDNTHASYREDIGTHTRPPYAQTHISPSRTNSSIRDEEVNNEKAHNIIRTESRKLKTPFCITSKSIYLIYVIANKGIKSTIHK